MGLGGMGAIGSCGIGDAGLAALAPALRKLPALKELFLYENHITTPAALVDNLDEKELQRLEVLSPDLYQIGDAGMAKLALALDGGAMPALTGIVVHEFDLQLLPREQPAGEPPASAALRMVLERRGIMIHESSAGKPPWPGGDRSEYLDTDY